MKPSVLRLVLASALFLGWLGWLTYLAVTTTRPIILSRPQLLVSTLDVIADIDSEEARKDGRVRIQEVHWPAGRTDLQGQTLTVTNLANCHGWQGPGKYILPLEKHGEKYQVADIPLSPGYSVPEEALIYHYDARTAKQLEAIPKRKDEG